jgi:hypothetical protein
VEFLKRWFGPHSKSNTSLEPAKGPTLLKNVRSNNLILLKFKKDQLYKLLAGDPKEHLGDLFYELQKYAQYEFELAMLDWRRGVDPSPYFHEIERTMTEALSLRPDILSSKLNPSFLAILSHLLGWNFSFNTDPPHDDERKFEMVWLDRWIIAGLAGAPNDHVKPSVVTLKNQFIRRSLEDYWALLTEQVDPQEGIARCIKNYDRRATHPTFGTTSSYYGGSVYNELYVDYTLAAILKKRGLMSNTVHDWIWD